MKKLRINFQRKIIFLQQQTIKYLFCNKKKRHLLETAQRMAAQSPESRLAGMVSDDAGRLSNTS